MKSNTATQNKVLNKMMTVTGGGFPKTKRSALHKSGMKKKGSVFSKSTKFYCSSQTLEKGENIVQF